MANSTNNSNEIYLWCNNPNESAFLVQRPAQLVNETAIASGDNNYQNRSFNALYVNDITIGNVTTEGIVAEREGHLPGAMQYHVAQGYTGSSGFHTGRFNEWWFAKQLQVYYSNTNYSISNTNQGTTNTNNQMEIESPREWH